MLHSRLAKYFSIIICSILATLISAPCQAEVIRVATADFPTIQSGIDVAIESDIVVVANCRCHYWAAYNLKEAT